VYSAIALSTSCANNCATYAALSVFLRPDFSEEDLDEGFLLLVEVIDGFRLDGLLFVIEEDEDLSDSPTGKPADEINFASAWCCNLEKVSLDFAARGFCDTALLVEWSRC